MNNTKMHARMPAPHTIQIPAWPPGTVYARSMSGVGAREVFTVEVEVGDLARGTSGGRARPVQVRIDDQGPPPEIHVGPPDHVPLPADASLRQ
jgi:hypothetical protein